MSPDLETSGAQGASRRRRSLSPRVAALAWLLLPSFVVALSVLGLWRWRIPTAAEIEVAANRIHFQTRGEDQQVLLEPTRASSMALRGFQEVRFPASAVWIANPAKYDLKNDRYPEDAWKLLPEEQSIALRPADPGAATVTIQPAAKSGGALLLERIFTGPAGITLEAPEKNSLQIGLRGPNLSRTVSLSEEFRMVADYCIKEGKPWPHQSPSVTLRVRPRGTNARLEFTSREPGVLLAISFSLDPKERVLASEGLAVDQVEFLDQGPTGRPVSTLSGPGTIKYRDYPGIEPVRVDTSDFLKLGDLRRFRLVSAKFPDEGKGLNVRLIGIAGILVSGPEEHMRDRRLTQFENLWRNTTLVTLFAVLVWLVPTLAAVRKFYRELHR